MQVVVGHPGATVQVARPLICPGTGLGLADVVRIANVLKIHVSTAPHQRQGFLRNMSRDGSCNVSRLIYVVGSCIGASSSLGIARGGSPYWQSFWPSDLKVPFVTP
jgi:hypothetical protein